MFASETLAMQRNHGNAHFGLHLFGNAVDVFAGNCCGTSHCDKNCLRIVTLLGCADCLTEFFAAAKHHIFFHEVGADTQSVLLRFAATCKTHMHCEVEFCVLATAPDWRVVDKHAVGEVADLTLHNCVGAHSLLIERTLQFAKPATLTCALAATVFLDASLVVSGLFDQFLC